MAIRKVSRLQHRRGLKSDLPKKLHEAELGFCLDTRELFIGDSDAAPGNSQILTEWTPNDEVISHAYFGSTGVPAATVSRTLGSKLDDYVSVRDYGAVGNGVLDDTVPLQLAIVDCYNKAVANGFDQLQAYVTIWVPAGKYKITQALKLYPFVKLQGDGSARTTIFIDSDTEQCIAQTVDSDGNEETNIGIGLADIPVNIYINGITLLQPKLDRDGLCLDRCSRIKLTDVVIAGPLEYNTQTVTSGTGILIRSFGSTPKLIPIDIKLNDVEIYGFTNALTSNDPIKDLHLIDCNIHDHINGLSLGALALLGGPTMTKVTNCVFRNIETWAIKNNGESLGVVTSGCSFDTVGVVGISDAIIWGPASTGCASIGDQFVNIGLKAIRNQNPAYNVIVGPQKNSIQVTEPDLIGPLTLVDNHPSVPVSTVLTYDVTMFNTIVLSYSLGRDVSKRVGTITILTDGTTAVLQDEYNTLGVDLGVTFGYKILSGKLTLTYLTTNTGVDAAMYYTESKWFT